MEVSQATIEIRLRAGTSFVGFADTFPGGEGFFLVRFARIEIRLRAVGIG